MNRKHILLAEDDPLEAELTLGALKSRNFEDNVFLVQDGEEVLDYLYCPRRIIRIQEVILAIGIQVSPLGKLGA